MNDDSPQKQCHKCGAFFPATRQFFHAHSGTRDSLNPSCKQCCNGMHKPRARCPKGQKFCYTCKQCLPATTEFFYQHKRDGLSSECRPCTIIRNTPPPSGVKTGAQLAEQREKLSESLRLSERAR